jgi:hypothetical protein
VAHDRLTRLQEQAGQVAVDEGCGWHLFNMLNEWIDFATRVFPAMQACSALCQIENFSRSRSRSRSHQFKYEPFGLCKFEKD